LVVVFMFEENIYSTIFIQINMYTIETQ